jgi:hypothetical protein
MSLTRYYEIMTHMKSEKRLLRRAARAALMALAFATVTVYVWVSANRQDDLDSRLVAAVYHADPQAVKALLPEGANAESKFRVLPRGSMQDPPQAALARPSGIRGLLTKLRGTQKDLESVPLIMMPVDPAYALVGEYSGPRETLSRVECLRLLLEHGANANDANYAGSTALTFASCTVQIESAKLLLSHGADPNCTTEGYLMTPLMWASLQNQTALVKMLLAHGADPLRRNIKGQTALQMCLGGGPLVGERINVAALLQAAEASRLNDHDTNRPRRVAGQ